MKSKKLLIITTVPMTFRDILKGQPKKISQYYDVSLVSSNSPYFEQVSKDEGVTFFSVPMERGINVFKDLISLYRMILLFNKVKPDAIHSYTPKAGLISMLAGAVCKIPSRIHTFTGLIFPTSTGLKRFILMLMDRLICFCATTVVPEGEGVKKDLINFRITKKNMEVIGNGNIAGVDTSYYSPRFISKPGLDIRSQFSIPVGSFVFVYAGRLTLDKGISELLQALPENAHLILVGEQDTRSPLPIECQQKISSASNIHVTGWLSDIRPALSIANTFVLPSYREGFPNTILQCGSMGVPAIVTNINGSNEVIYEGYNGWVIEPKSSDKLKHAMSQAMQSDYLIKIGNNARSNVKNKYEKEAYHDFLIDFYSKAI
ncbi:glycosyltransferase family 4 protein [Vibrio cyclitrophicus]|uniref:glycosyltransferase family 4 protein n=1 Tax=Vibrio cyclitrophicus TaxID=47951 RepID=UPI0011B67041|nr:glycosyltransferase family 4 protein [Vibrio cyclitrophicus]